MTNPKAAIWQTNDKVFAAAWPHLAAIWKATHRDYKGRIGGKRAILVLREGGTQLVPLEDLTEAEIARRLPR